MSVRLASVLGIVICIAGCRFDEGGMGAITDGSAVDARRLDATNGDAATNADAMIDAAIDAPVAAVGTHLLLSEVKAQGSDSEFIEIFNPTASTVQLDRYYLADHSDYALLPGELGGPAPQIGLPFDFVVRFPNGASIAPRGVVVVAIKGTSFTAQYGFAADFAISVADSAELMDGVILGNTPALTDTGEAIILFFWDGQTDLVRDVDMMIAGNAPTSVNGLSSKTGVVVDGPDGDITGSTYAPDGFTIGDIDGDAAEDESYKRIGLEGVFEAMTGAGNGITGDDETTEATSVTWDDAATFTAPTPGSVPASINP